MPDDQGVKLNHGRVGAAEGPAAFRASLARYGTAFPAGFVWPAVFDAGDVQPGNELEETHDRVTTAAAELTRRGHTVVGIGGGHDLTFALVRGVTSVSGPLAGVYLDAHLDVRAERGSGMPFRRLLESGAATSMRVHGLDPFANSEEHVDWFLAHGGRIEESSDPAQEWPVGGCFLSLDLDVIDQSAAPGVSAMNPCGWSSDLAERWCFAAGAHSGLRCFDLMELSPPHDAQGRTARLAARLFLAFLRGFATRSGA